MEALLQTIGAFHDMVLSYRQCFLLNLAVYYTVEVPGHERKATDFILAFDECRQHVRQSHRIMRNRFKRLMISELGAFRTIPDRAEFRDARKNLQHAEQNMEMVAKKFWKAVDAWASERRQKAFDPLG